MNDGLKQRGRILPHDSLVDSCQFMFVEADVDIGRSEADWHPDSSQEPAGRQSSGLSTSPTSAAGGDLLQQ